MTGCQAVHQRVDIARDPGENGSVDAVRSVSISKRLMDVE
jgi:hypothetical protein